MGNGNNSYQGIAVINSIDNSIITDAQSPISRHRRTQGFAEPIRSDKELGLYSVLYAL